MTLLLAVLIAVLALGPLQGMTVPGSDKMHHGIAFAALAFPLPFARPRLVVPVAAGVIAYGGLIEIIQPYFGRSAEWGDFVADVLGAILGAGMGALMGHGMRMLVTRRRHEPIHAMPPGPKLRWSGPKKTVTPVRSGSGLVP